MTVTEEDTLNTGLSPTVVGLLRGLVYAVLIAALAAGVAFAGGLSADDLGQYAWALPFIAAAARSLEGFVDKLRGQAPQLPGGSKPSDPNAYVPPAVDPPQERTPVDLDAVATAVAGAMPRSSTATRTRVTAAVMKAVRP